MAFLITSRLLMKQFIQSEKIFKNIVNLNSVCSDISDKYLAEIKKLKIDPNVSSVTELLRFPSKTFYVIDKKSLECIMHNSYNIIKEKGLATTPEVYKSILNSYLYDRIDFDVKILLKDMAENKIPLDQDIYNYIVRYFCNNRNIEAVEYFLSDMKCKGIKVDDLMKKIIISAYTAAKQTAKSEIFIRENQLEPNGFDVLFSKCYGFACIGDMDNLKRNLFEIKEKQFPLTGFHCKLLYSRLLSANVDKSSLDEIIDLTKNTFNDQPQEIYQLVSRLNTENNFEISIHLIKKLINFIKNSSPIIASFSSPRCPFPIFMEVLEVLTDHNGRCSKDIDIFAGFTMDKAFEIGEKFYHIKNWKIIHYSLLNRAIKEKSIPLIERSLTFSYTFLQWPNINLLLHEAAIHLLLENGIVSNYEEIMDIFPNRRRHFMAVILMEYLCAGEFNRYNKLRLKYDYHPMYVINTRGNYLSKLLAKHFSNEDIEKWIIEARKYFNNSVINQILCEFAVYKMMKLSRNDSLNEMEESVYYMKKWDVKLYSWQFHLLLVTFPAHAELIESLGQANINPVVKI